MVLAAPIRRCVMCGRFQHVLPVAEPEWGSLIAYGAKFWVCPDCVPEKIADGQQVYPTKEIERRVLLTGAARLGFLRTLATVHAHAPEKKS